jgi:hypothetical protein
MSRQIHLRRLLALLLALPVLGAVGLYGLEQLTSDAATRLAFEIRNQSILLKLSDRSTRTFAHRPWSWPEGVSGDYRIEIKEGADPFYPGQRFIGVARNWTESTWFHTTYHMNFVEVPNDLKVSHRQGDETRVTLEKRDGKILLTRLE